MKLTRLAVAVAFLVMALTFLADFHPLSAQGACESCSFQGSIVKCDGQTGTTDGTPSGNCVTVEAVAVSDPNLPQGTVCIKTTYFNCAAVGNGTNNGGGCGGNGGPSC